ncbi:hypothetical protein IJI72_02300 [Candidatus Saccharibacteria bacterium]|nr:hypothetical protein [Candidatus Saccharibacteria bacterium]
MKRLFPTILALGVVLFALPYLSSGVSVFMGKWAYDWGLPVPALKLILLAVSAVILALIFNLIKKAVIITVIAALVLVGLNALGLYNMKTDPKELIGQISTLASDNSETIVTATKDLFYQATAYATAVNPVQTVMDFASGEEAFWYLTKKSESLDLSLDIFKGYRVADEKTVGEFTAYRLIKE